MVNTKDGEIKELRPAVYLRVSTDGQKEKYGIDLQRTAIKHFLNAKHDCLNFDKAKLYIDEGVSGTLKINDRPGLKELFDDLKYSPEGEPPFDIVVVYKIDRFARDLRILLDIVGKLKDYGVDFASTQESIDTSTPFGKAMLSIMGAFAELDRDMIIEKTHAGLKLALQDGVVYKTRFGYKKNTKKKLVIHKKQAEIVKDIFFMFTQDKYSVGQICNVLTEKKIRIPTAWSEDTLGSRPVKNIYKWADKTVRIILADEIYIGKYYFNKTASVKNPNGRGSKQVSVPKEDWVLGQEHTPIIDNLTFEKAQAILETKQGNYKSSNEYLLGGLLKCDYCKGDKVKGMVGWSGTSMNKGKYYQCSGKNTKKYENPCCTIPVPKDELETIVKEQIKQIIKHPEAIKKHLKQGESVRNKQEIISKEITKINEKIDKSYVKLDNFEKLFISGDSSFTPREYMKLKDEIKYQIKKYEQERENLKMRLAQSVEEEKQIMAMDYLQKILKDIDGIFDDFEKCKILLNTLVEDIVVYSEVDETIKLTGRKKKGNQKQALPKGIIINFRLPQDFINDILIPSNLQKEIEEAEKEYGVKVKSVNIKKETTTHIFGGDNREAVKGIKRGKDGTFLTSWEDDIK